MGDNEVFPLSKGTWDICADIRKPKRRLTNFVLCSGLALPFCDGVFKVAVASDVIEHTPNPLQFLKEMRRVAFKAVVVTPNSQYLGCILKACFSREKMYYTHFDHLFTFSKFELTQIFKRAGYTRVEVTYGDFNRANGRLHVGRFCPFTALKYRALRGVAC